MRPRRWSYSSLITWEECPAKWKYRYIDKLPDPPSPAMERGTRLHSLCEQVLNGECETPNDLAKVARVLDRLRVNQAKAEQAWRVDANWQAVASGSWLLGYVDVTFTRDAVLHVYDFKSGKPYPSHRDQLELYALLGMAQHPDVPAVTVGAIYLDTGEIGARRTVSRADADALRSKWTGRAVAMMADESYSAKRGRGCYWCAFKDSLGGPCHDWA